MQNKIISKDKKTIKKFLDRYSRRNNTSYKIVSYPDLVNRNKKDVDAIAEVGNLEYAIEHTSLDTYCNQRGDSARIRKLFTEEFLNKLKNYLPGNNKYIISVENNVIPKGINDKNVRQRIIEWIEKNKSKLKPGNPPNHFIRGFPSNVPCEITLYCFPRNKKSINLAVNLPKDLDNHTEKTIEQILNKRGRKLAEYKNKHFYTLLILESNDFQLDRSLVGDTFAKVINEKNNSYLKEKIDEVYLIETEDSSYYFTCLKKQSLTYPESLTQDF